MLQPNFRFRALLVTATLSAAAAASGCAAPQPKVAESLDTAYNFGEASQQTFAAQIKNPSPIYDHRMDSSGARATQALERYRTDTVKQPTTVRTSNLAVGSSGSSASGAGADSGSANAGSSSSGLGSSETDGGAASAVSISSAARRQSVVVDLPPTNPIPDPPIATIRQLPNGDAITNTGVILFRSGDGYVGPDGTHYTGAGPNGVTNTTTGVHIPQTTPMPPQPDQAPK